MAMQKLNLPTAPPRYDIRDQDNMRSLLERAFTIPHTHVASEILAGTFASGTFVFPGTLKLEGHVYAAMYDVGDRATNYTVDWDNGIKQRIAATGDITITVDDGDLSGGGYTIAIVASGAARTISWSGITGWGSAGAPATPLAQDSTLIVKIDVWGAVLIGNADITTTTV